MITLSIVVSLVMLIVSILHFYWAFGGKYGLESAGPKLEGKEDFVPGGTIIFIVACLLFGLAVLPLQLLWPIPQLENVTPYLGYLVSAIFILRGIGDFKYVGMFKKNYNSKFARLDTRYFSPLILLLGLAYALLSKHGA